MRILFHIIIRLIILCLLTFTGFVKAQFDVVYVKGKVYYKSTTTGTDTPREVKVGDKIERTTPLDFSKDKSAYVALYNPSYGRIVIPDKEEINNHNSSGNNTSRPLRGDTVFDSYIFIIDKLNYAVILSDSVKLDLNPFIENDVRAFELFSFIDKIEIFYRFSYLAEDSSIKTIERRIHNKNLDYVRTITVGKKYLLVDLDGNPIDQRHIVGYPSFIVRISEKNSASQSKGKNNTMPRKRLNPTDTTYLIEKDKSPVRIIKHKGTKQTIQVEGFIQFRFPDSTETLKKEVQTLLNGYLVAGNNINESVSAIVPYIEKYYGKVFREDVEAWIRKHFTIEIKK